MRKLTLALLIITTCVFATRSQQRQDPPWVKDVAGKRIVYSVPGMEKVRVRKDQIYKRADGRDLLMDIYFPGTKARVPAVLFIHGGRIPPNLLTTPKDWAVYVSLGQLVAASGFVGVTFNHRFHSWESLADSQNDVMEAIKYVRANAATLGVDPDRIILWAISAGGIFLSEVLREHPPYVSAIVAYYTVLDLRTDRASVPASVSDETLKNFSPVYYLEQTEPKFTTGQQPQSNLQGVRDSVKPNPLYPPMQIARAGLDSGTLNAGLDRFVQSALKNNITLDLLNHPTGHHGFDIQDNNDRSREILKRTIEFMKINTH